MPESLYAQPEELRTQTGKEVVVDDPALENILRAASQAIDLFCNRPDGFLALTTATARVYSGSGKIYQWIAECIQVTLVEVKASVTDSTYTAWATGDWLPFSGDPENPDFNRTPYNGILVDPTGDQSYFVSGRYTQLRGFRPEENWQGRGAPTVRVTAKWGYAQDIPPIVNQACITIAARWFKRARGAWGDSIGNPEMGQVFYRKVIDPDVKMMLEEARLVMPAIGALR